MNAAAAILLALLAAGVSPEEARRAVDQVYEDGDYQTELPGEATLGDEGRVGPDVPPEEVRRGTAKGPGDGLRIPRAAGPIARFFGAVMEHILLVLIGVLVVVALVLAGSWVARVVRDRARRKGAPAPEDPGAATEGGPGLRIPDSADLAREGRFAEAIHTLLLRAQAELMRRADRPFPPALTSREILSRGGVPDGATGDLTALVRAVERILFAGREAAQPDYETCVGHYEGFVGALPGAAR